MHRRGCSVNSQWGESSGKQSYGVGRNSPVRAKNLATDPYVSCREDMLDQHLTFRTAAPGDLHRVHSLEEAGYPADEAASLDSLTYRIHQASSVFLVATLGSELVGFVCGTQTPRDELDHASMFTHDPQGNGTVSGS
ncbi:unnamed protein product [Closterium sp. NIES-65]|nr:unnamed protein product [Closterium sp. NIES-65]